MDAAHKLAQLVRQVEQGEACDLDGWLALLRAQDRESGRIAQLTTQPAVDATIALHAQFCGCAGRPGYGWQKAVGGVTMVAVLDEVSTPVASCYSYWASFSFQ